jgi:hypothetical protein
MDRNDNNDIFVSIQRILIYNARARLCAMRALEHPFVKGMRNPKQRPVPPASLDWELLLSGGKSKTRRLTAEGAAADGAANSDAQVASGAIGGDVPVVGNGSNNSNGNANGISSNSMAVAVETGNISRD